jgi:MYXO-CTERM domain-containing protein
MQAGNGVDGKGLGRGDFVFYLAVTLIFTWPLALHPFSRLMAPVGPGDPYLNLWILGWDLRTLTTDPLAVVTGRVFNANIFYPADLTLAYSDHLILQAVVLWPLYLVFRDLTLCYNVLLFGSLLASALAMHAFTYSVTGSRWGARASGLAWGLLPYRFAHLLHLQLQGLYFLPLSFLFLHRLIAGRRRSDAVGLGVMAGLQAITSIYYGVIGAIGLVTGAAALWFAVGRWQGALFARRLLLAVLVGAVLVAPFAWPYWLVQQREGFGRNLYEASHHSASPVSYLRAPPGNLLYGRSGLLRASPTAPPPAGQGPERELFPGFALLALAGFGFWRARRRDSWPLALSMTSVMAAGFVLSLGPDGLRPLYATLHRFVFGFQAIRAPARFGVLVAFGLACLAALGMREIAGTDAPRGRPTWRRGAVMLTGQARAVALLCLMGLEFLNVPLPSVPAPPRQTPAGQWLATAPERGAVLYLPFDDSGTGNTPAMVQSLEHGMPIVNGSSGQRPAFFVALVEVLNQFPSAESLWTLHDLDVRYVVSPKRVELTPTAGGAAPAAGASLAAAAPVLPLVERANVGGLWIYELRWTREAEAVLRRPELPAPPDPGPLPFRNHEEAVYEVTWLGAGNALGLTTGTATITAERVSPGSERSGGTAPIAAYRLTVSARTADWVSRFFQAQDQFVTVADQALLPLLQEQHLREGSRRVDRSTVYDQVQRLVRVGGDVTLPMERGARDPLTAFFYARAVPLRAGTTVRIPLSESGRNLVVELRVVGPERVSYQGRLVDGLRVEPKITARLQRRRPIEATLWLSADDRAVPLVLEISAGFGSFRAELASYRRD